MVPAQTATTPRAPAAGHRDGIQHILRPSGAARCRSHRAGQHHGLGGASTRLQEERGLFQRIGSVGDRRAADVRLRQPVPAPQRQAPQSPSHVLAVDLRNLFRTREAFAAAMEPSNSVMPTCAAV
jgi:hypothetical protein